jgi:hypothetical protein
MTKWEIGQDLIAISDFIYEKRQDIKDSGNLELNAKLSVIQAQIGDLFNENNDHAFGIFDSKNLIK